MVFLNIIKSVSTIFLLTVLLLLTPTPLYPSVVVIASYQFIQIGADIDGEADFDRFGTSVSMSGDGLTFVVGALLASGRNGTYSGHVRVYKFNATIKSYAQVGLDIDGEAASDSFGSSVSMSGDGTTFVVGGIWNDGINGPNSGHVRVYKLNSALNTYVQFGKDIDGEAESDSFGSSVSMSGDGTTFVVGAPFKNGINGIFSGHVRVYKFNSTINTYAQIGSDIDGEAALDGFGVSVSMSADGTTFVVGAPGNNGVNGSDSGQVRVYKFNSTINTYAQLGMDIDGDLSGKSVSMSGDGTTFVVGAPLNNGINGTYSGRVRVYKFNSTSNMYATVGSDIDGVAAVDFFGTSVSMSADGTTFVAGAESNDGINGTNSGHVRVYKFNSTINKYAQIGLDVDGEAADDLFGNSVSLSADGTTFVVGAPRNDGVYGIDSGHVRVYSTSVMRPTKSPTKAPNSPTTNCKVSWKLFNSQTDSFVANLSNGTMVTTPPPCQRTNIKAVVPCGDWNNEVTIELFRKSNRVHRRVEKVVPYFLFGNGGSNVLDGRIEPGTYRIRASVNDVFTPFTTFTLLGPKCH